MSKLEQKLQELGYEYVECKNCFGKKQSRFISIFIELNKDKSKVNDYDVEYTANRFRKQEQIDNLQQAFNTMQKDLEILKDIDKPTPKNDIGNELWEKDVKHMQKLGEWERKQWNY